MQGCSHRTTYMSISPVVSKFYSIRYPICKAITPGVTEYCSSVISAIAIQVYRRVSFSLDILDNCFCIDKPGAS